MLEIKLGALHLLGKHIATELNAQPLLFPSLYSIRATNLLVAATHTQGGMAVFSKSIWPHPELQENNQRTNLVSQAHGPATSQKHHLPAQEPLVRCLDTSRNSAPTSIYGETRKREHNSADKAPFKDSTFTLGRKNKQAAQLPAHFLCPPRLSQYFLPIHKEHQSCSGKHSKAIFP